MRIQEAKLALKSGMDNSAAQAVSAWAYPGDRRSVIRIDQPGVYALVQDVNGARGKSGIRIDAEEVSLFLGGFAVRGCPGSVDGIEVIRPGAVVRVWGGAIGGWGRHGFNGYGAAWCRLGHLNLSDNAGGNIMYAGRTELVNCGRGTGEPVPCWKLWKTAG